MDPRPYDQPYEHGQRGRGALAGLEALEAFDAPVAPPPASIPAGVPVPRSVRTGIRRKGPFVALLLPAALGVAAIVMLRGSTSTGSGVGGFLVALLAAPLLPAFGAPLRTGSGGVMAAAAASAVLWFLLGAFAAARATRTPYSGWGRYWVEYLWLCSCVWLGAILAEVAANLVLGRVLL